MAKTYRVWVSVEEYDPDTDSYRDVDLPFSAIAEFGEEEAAVAFATAIQAKGEGMVELVDNLPLDEDGDLDWDEFEDDEDDEFDEDDEDQYDDDPDYEPPGGWQGAN